MRAAMALEQFGSSRGRTGARIEKHNADFPLRERLINHRQVTDNEREESEAQAAFEDGHHAFAGSVRCDVPEAKSKERGAAQVEARLQRRVRRIVTRRAVVHESEADDQ